MRLLSNFQEETTRKEIADADTAGGDSQMNVVPAMIAVPVFGGADTLPLRLPSNQEMNPPEMAHRNNANALITPSWLELLHKLPTQVVQRQQCNKVGFEKMMSSIIL